MLSPPLDMKAKWFEHSTAYTMAKFGMSMCVLGLSAELKAARVAVNALWPRTTIATAAVGNLLGGDAMMRASRTPEIMGDAALSFSQSRRARSPDSSASTTRCFTKAACATSSTTA